MLTNDTLKTVAHIMRDVHWTTTKTDSEIRKAFAKSLEHGQKLWRMSLPTQKLVEYTFCGFVTAPNGVQVAALCSGDHPNGLSLHANFCRDLFKSVEARGESFRDAFFLDKDLASRKLAIELKKKAEETLAMSEKWKNGEFTK